jgi:Tfp pilus assembly protein PilF
VTRFRTFFARSLARTHAHPPLPLPSQAVASLQHALSLAPDDVETLVAVAAILGRRGQADAERGLLQRAVANDPLNTAALVNLGCNLGDAGCSAEEEIGLYRRAVAADAFCKDAQ